MAINIPNAVTIITPTSPIPSHPSTRMITRAIQSAYQRAGLDGCRHVVVCDGCPPRSPLRSRYREYLHNLQELGRASGFEVFHAGRPVGLPGVIAEALDSCRLAVILATETYGVTTNGMFDTYKELAFIVSEKKPVSGLSFAHTQTLS